MSSQRCGFRGDTFHQITVGDDPVNVRLDDLMSWLVELRREMRRSYRHSHTLTKSLAEWTRRRLHARCQHIFRMPRRLATELAEVLDLFHGEIISGEVQQRVKQHGAMPARKD